MTPRFPTVIADRFVLQGELGRGAMGVVHRALDRDMNRQVAIKILLNSVSPEVLTRFRHEGEMTAQLSHPGIVRVFGAGETEGRPYLVYELVSGLSLERAEGLSQVQSLEILRQAADALGHAHRQGVVHRDVKPANAILDEHGRVRILDFGIAWTANSEALTRTGTLLGTPSYMAPEAISGKPAAAPADVWALGVWLYEWLSGSLPFEANNLAALAGQIQAGSYPRLPATCPAGAQAVVDRCLRPDPTQRYADGVELATALEAVCAGNVPSRRVPIRLGLGLLVVTGLAAVFLSLKHASDSQTAASATLAPSLDLHAVRAGIAPLPSASEGSAALLCWSGVRQLLAGEAPTEHHRRLASAATPAGHALAAALAARDGSALEVERHLRKHGKPRRAELELLPYLAAARAGRLSEPKARAALDLFEDRRGPTPTELGGLLALAQVVAKKRSEQQVLAESGREAPQLPTWTREKILLELRTPLATTSLAAIVEFGQGLGPECGAVLTQRVSEVLLQDAPRVGQVSLPRARIARVAVAIRAFRTLAPHPHPLPAREGLSAFAAGRITALSSDLAEPVGEEGFDFALALADALPDDALIQSTAGQAIWNARLTSPARWRGLLRVAGRELATVRSQETAIRPRLEAKVLSRLLCLLRGLQEFLPPAARDPKQLERALVVIDRRAQLDPKHALDAPADRAYVRLLLGRLEQSELDALPARNVSPRVKLARLYLAPEELSRVPDLLAALRYVRREVAPGALLHRCGLDLLWPKEGPASPSASAREPYIDQLASALARRNRPYSLHWRIQAARLALPIAPGRCRQKLSRAASLALTAGWTEQSRALNTAASAPTDALLAELADQALELERNP